MIELVKTLGIAGAACVLGIFLVRDVLGPLVRYVVEKKQKDDADNPRKMSERVKVLEVNLSTFSARVTELSELIDERATAADNKLDIVLAEMRDMRGAQSEQHRQLGERLARLEENVKHLEKTRGR